MEMDLSILTSFFCLVHVGLVAKVVFMFFCREMSGVKPCISCLGGYGYGRSVTGQRLEVPAESVVSWGFPWPPAVAQTAPGRLRSSQPIKADQTWSKLIELSENDQEIPSYPLFLGLSFDSLVWENVGEMVQLHGKSAGMVSPRGKALDPAHSDSQRLSLALFPALGTSQAADGSGRSVNFTSCLLLNFHSFLHLGLPKSPTIHDRCSSLVGYLFRGSPEQRSNETRRPNQDENLILVGRPKKNFLYPSFRQKISMVPTNKIVIK